MNFSFSTRPAAGQILKHISAQIELNSLQHTHCSCFPPHHLKVENKRRATIEIPGGARVVSKPEQKNVMQLKKKKGNNEHIMTFTLLCMWINQCGDRKQVSPLLTRQADEGYANGKKALTLPQSSKFTFRKSVLHSITAWFASRFMQGLCNQTPWPQTLLALFKCDARVFVSDLKDRLLQVDPFLKWWVATEVVRSLQRSYDATCCLVIARLSVVVAVHTTWLITHSKCLQSTFVTRTHARRDTGKYVIQEVFVPFTMEVKKKL